METKTLKLRIAPADRVHPTFRVNEIISALSLICESRKRAYSFYPYATSPDKWEAIELIRYNLHQAKGCMNPREAASICLRQDLAFHTIADRSTPARQATYLKKLNCIMDACRSYLGLQKQS